MHNSIDFRDFKHSKYKLDYILLINTFSNKKIINSQIEIELKKIIYNIFENHNSCVVKNIELEEQSKLIVSFETKPNIQLSKLVNNFKTVSSRLIRSRFSLQFDEQINQGSFWEQKYYVYTNSAA